MEQNKTAAYNPDADMDAWVNEFVYDPRNPRQSSKDFEKRLRRRQKWERGRQRQQRRFLLKQLIKRDFTGRYKRAALGVLWSMLSPLCHFAAQALVFSFFFQRGEHFISYLIIGNIVYHYFTDATNQCMHSITGNVGIISRVNINPEIFLISKTISCFLNFCLTLCIMFLITSIDHMPFSVRYFALLFPIACEFFFNLGIGYILAAMHVFFQDTQYFYGIATTILHYFCAVFYKLDRFPPEVQRLFFLNPVYCYIAYCRDIILSQSIPTLELHLRCFAYAAAALILGKLIYTLCRDKFSYYY